jgi:hypothetical protein
MVIAPYGLNQLAGAKANFPGVTMINDGDNKIDGVSSPPKPKRNHAAQYAT